MMNNKTATAPALGGGCLCGAIRYVVRGTPLSASVCHCSTCRRAAGAQSVAWGIWRRADVTFLAGSLAVFRSSAHVERGHCAGCGTSILFREDGEDTMDLTLASLDNPAAIPPTKETWLAHRLPWEALDPERDQIAAGPGPLDTA